MAAWTVGDDELRIGGAGGRSALDCAGVIEGCGGQEATNSVPQVGQATVDPTFLVGTERGFWQFGQGRFTGMVVVRRRIVHRLRVRSRQYPAPARNVKQFCPQIEDGYVSARSAFNGEVEDIHRVFIRPRLSSPIRPLAAVVSIRRFPAVNTAGVFHAHVHV